MEYTSTQLATAKIRKRCWHSTVKQRSNSRPHLCLAFTQKNDTFHISSAIRGKISADGRGAQLCLDRDARGRGKINMGASRYFVPLFVAIFVLAIVVASPVNAANQDPNRLGGAERPPELAGGWHYVRTPNPHGGADAISIMHTADTSRSDLDLAGLMIRCREGGSEAVIVLIRAFPLRARPHVVLGKPGSETQFEATIAAPGTAILLPGDATTLVNRAWQAQSDLSIQVDDGQTTIRGVVELAGLQAAFKVLLASCSTQ